MNNARLTASVIGGSLAAMWAALSVARSFSAEFNVAVYALASLVVSLDLIDLAVRLFLRHRQVGMGSHTSASVPLDENEFSEYQKRLHLRPFALVVSVYNIADEVDEFLERMGRHKDRLWVIDDRSTDGTCERLRQEGIRCIEGHRNRKKPGALRQLVASLPPEVETVVVLDPDIEILDSPSPGCLNLEAVIFDFQRSGMAAVCPRMRIKPDGLLARFQALEFCMAYSFGRASLANQSITSGAAIYRRTALETMMRRHSMSVYAEDLENSILLLSDGEDVYYDPRLVLETHGKTTVLGWFSQRVGWSYGLIRVLAANPGKLWSIARRGPAAAYQYLIYLGLVSLILHPLRVASGWLLAVSFLHAVDELLALEWLPDSAPGGVYFLAIYLKYLFLSFAAVFLAVPRSERLQVVFAAPLYFFYSLTHLVPVTVGYANWFSLRLFGCRVWRDQYQSEESLRETRRHSWKETGAWT